jgi:hypothetical protein|nr:MAG TPA: hypothetical protein [Caudoviricetes sp.]
MEEKEDLKYEIIQLHICLEHLKNAKKQLKRYRRIYRQGI